MDIKNIIKLSHPEITLVLIHLTISMCLSVCYFMQLYLVDKYHLTLTTAGVLFSIYSFGTMIGGFTGGKLSDYCSPKIICMLSLLGVGVSFVSLAFLNNFILITVNLFLLGILIFSAITSIYVLTISLAGDKEQRLKIINLLDIASNLGLGIASLVIGFFKIDFLKYFILIAGFISTLSAFFLLHYFRGAFFWHHKQEYASKHEKKCSKLKIHYIYMCVLCAGIIISQLSGSYAIYLNSLALTQYNLFSALFAMNTFLVVFLQLPILKRIIKCDYIFVAALGILLLGFGMSLLIIKNTYIIVTSCLIYTLGEILFFAVALSILYESTPPSKKGSMLGKYRTILGISRIVGPTVGGFLYQANGANSVWIACGFFGLFCFAIYYLSFKDQMLYSRNHVEMRHHAQNL